MAQQYNRCGFLKLRFTVAKGSIKEAIIKRIIYFEDKLKLFLINLLLLIPKSKKLFYKYNYIRRVTINKLNFVFYDNLLSNAVPSIEEEMNNNCYALDTIDFKLNDNVIDIGGNVGIVSIYLAMKYPFLKIYSFEPVKCNYNNFKKNIELNNICDGIINLENKAVAKDCKSVQIYFNPLNSGGCTVMSDNNVKGLSEETYSVTLDEVINRYNIDTIKLLKIDCEGAEYEILYNLSIKNLKKILHLRGEFHKNKDYEPVKLIEYCKKYISDVDISICS